MANVHQTFALILPEEDVDVVQNIIISDNYEFANSASRERYGSGSYAIDCTQYAVKIGDTYNNGTFIDKDTGEVIKRVNTTDEDVALALQEIESLKDTISVVSETVNKLLNDTSAN